jgi:hypothetical protein
MGSIELVLLGWFWKRTFIWSGHATVDARPGTAVYERPRATPPAALITYIQCRAMAGSPGIIARPQGGTLAASEGITKTLNPGLFSRFPT